jgi:hypothetical protein
LVTFPTGPTTTVNNLLLQPTVKTSNSLSDELTSLLNSQLDNANIINTSTLLKQQNSSQASNSFLESELDDIMSSLQTSETIKSCIICFFKFFTATLCFWIKLLAFSAPTKMFNFTES